MMRAIVLTRHKLDVDDFYRMTDAGILDPKARVESDRRRAHRYGADRK